jgi:putative FmdB family regulatory protein
MPIFEYRCRRCNHRFETIVLSSAEKIQCPECAAAAVEKQLSVFSSPGSGKEQTTSPSGGCGCTPQSCGCH